MTFDWLGVLHVFLTYDIFNLGWVYWSISLSLEASVFGYGVMLRSTEAKNITILFHVFDYEEVIPSLIEPYHPSEGLCSLERRAVTHFG